MTRENEFVLDRIATVKELRDALEGMDDDLIVMVDGYIYVGPGSTYGDDW